MKHCFATISIVFFAIISVAQPGILDPSFGDNGYVITDLGKNYNRALSIAALSDGSIITAGGSQESDAKDFGSDFAVVKYKEDGNPADDFGTNGVVLTDLDGFSSDVATDISIQNDGKILVAGRTHAGAAYVDYKIAVVRYNTDGTLDESFGSQGKAFCPVESYDDYSYDVSMALQSDGKIVITGSSYLPVHDVFFTVRFTSDGEIDPSFGNNGTVATSLGDSFDGNPNAIAIQPDGKILVGGVGVGPLSYGTYADFALVRYEPDGAPDLSFGENGIVLTPLLGGYNAEWIEDLAIQNDGKIIAAGSTSEYNYDQRIGVARYNADGSPDDAFGTSGIVLTAIPGSNAFCRGVALTGSGDIIVAGFAESPVDGSSDFALVQYLPDGSLDTGFDGDGIVTTDINTIEGISDVKIQADEKIVVSGLTGNTDHHDFIVLRYLNNISGYQTKPDDSVDIFPNPVRDDLNVKMVDYHNTTFRIADMQGKLLVVSNPSSALTRLNLTSLSAGVYQFIIEKDKEIIFRNRIIKITE
jgi:uncharacterized delta-60 repeat protein